MITVFLATYNRLETLKRTLDSYDRFLTPYELVIVDNGTDNPRCLEFLEKYVARRDDVKKIYTLPKVNSMDELTHNYNIAVRDQYRTGLRQAWKSEWFAITDADICFEQTDPGALDAYIRLAYGLNCSAGPHMRVDKGIPAGYPLRSRVLSTEARITYSDRMNWYGIIPYNHYGIDTTFHLFPRVKEFKRLKFNTVRVGRPYDVMHLDWYLDIDNPIEENWIYMFDASPVGSWGRGWISGFWKNYRKDPEEALQYLLKEERISDLCNNAYMISWCYQYGKGTEKDPFQSVRYLEEAIPRHFELYWADKENWMRMIYVNDFSALGWDE